MAELASLLIKKDQVLVVRARFKRMSSKTTNMGAELRAEEPQNVSNISSITLGNLTTNSGICEDFREYFQDLFTREPGLSPAQFNTYLADFPRFDATACEGPI